MLDTTLKHSYRFAEREMVSGANTIKTILAVDDSAIVQQSIKRSLENDYRVLVTGNAVDALSLIYHEPISAVLLDVTMPGVDGLELCRTVRSLPQFQDLPIIMLTARDSPFDKVQGRLAGASEYLTKPFDAVALRQILEKLTQPNSPSSTT